MTQAQLAGLVGVERSAATQWEQPRGTTPSVENLVRIAKATGVHFEWLATGRGARQPENGEFDEGAMSQDFAHDEHESRALAALRILNPRRKEVAVRIIELLAE